MRIERRPALPLVVGLVVASAVCLHAQAPHARESREDGGAQAAFREARGYTVRVRTQIETPFLEDERGALEGAGFLVDAARGWIVTNAHVVGHSPSVVQVSFAGQPFQPARKLYVDSFADIAMLAITPSATRHAASLDPLATPSVGEAVGAFGHPLGVPFTGTRGIVSGFTDQFGPGLLQIDATVDHGNSGGPVIGLHDRRILGIATAGVGDKSERLNLATPIATVCRILDLMRAGANPSPPRMGFALLKDEDGRTTLRVGRSFDAAHWPFEPGDRIVAVAQGDSLRSLADFVDAFRGRTGSVPLVVERGTRRVTVTTHPTARHAVLDRRGVVIDGALIAPIDFEDETGAGEPARLIVHSVEPASTAQSLGFQRLDILHSVDGKRFDDLEALVGYLRRRSAGTPMTLVFRRWSDDVYRVFDYHSRTLPGDDVRILGPGPATSLASK